ncbi:maleate cis-trans isomerase family protein [Maritalea myrionectae]|uniref:maleate cis-trans isomerase family protein n=1 Tax=Maritalea myrionectae TaxID=454601 RepID=UPI000406D5DA|nr:Asp/Glu racemase [Maritalea myrionectae]
MKIDYETVPDLKPALGLIVLQADETLEQDMRRLMPGRVELHTTRIPSGAAVTRETLAAMATRLTGAAALLPPAAQFDCIGYGCTSGAAEIGADKVADYVRAGRSTAHVTNPLTALIAACQDLSIHRLALLSPYVADVSVKLRDALQVAGVATPVFGSFEEPEESKVVRISATSIRAAAQELAAQGDIDAVFLSCTNLRTVDIIDEMEETTGLPCLSSNQVLTWHMGQLSSYDADIPGVLGRAHSLT